MVANVPGNANTFLLELLLERRQQTTAVENFSQLHDRDELPLPAKLYRQLMPTSRPVAGEQYALIPMHDENANQLTHARFEPYSKQPSYKDGAVRIRHPEPWDD